MEIIKKYKWLVALALVVMLGAAVVLFLFYRDIQTLKDFSASYKKFDKEQSVDTLAELNIKATVRISSATQNDPELMSLMREIANLAGKEFMSLRDHKDSGDLTLKRKGAYARFLVLAGIKN